MTRRVLASVVAASALLAGGCGAPAPSATPRAASVLGTQTPTDGRYAELVDDLRATGTGVWVESDVVKAYLAGPTRYRQVLGTALALARRRGVAGIKVADELGYHDGTTPEQAADMLRRTVADIHASSPGTKVLIDVVVPELGCLSWTASSTAVMRMCGAGSTSTSSWRRSRVSGAPAHHLASRVIPTVCGSRIGVTATFLNFLVKMKLVATPIAPPASTSVVQCFLACTRLKATKAAAV